MHGSGAPLVADVVVNPVDDAGGSFQQGGSAGGGFPSRRQDAGVVGIHQRRGQQKLPALRRVGQGGHRRIGRRRYAGGGEADLPGGGDNQLPVRRVNPHPVDGVALPVGEGDLAAGRPGGYDAMQRRLVRVGAGGEAQEVVALHHGVGVLVPGHIGEVRRDAVAAGGIAGARQRITQLGLHDSP